jgi:hypothetical protein
LKKYLIFLERDRGGKKPTVCLLDGEKALWEWYRESLPEAVGIPDLFHVLERLLDYHGSKLPQPKKADRPDH